jgi:hypothetical protein
MQRPKTSLRFHSDTAYTVPSRGGWRFTVFVFDVFPIEEKIVDFSTRFLRHLSLLLSESVAFPTLAIKSSGMERINSLL